MKIVRKYIYILVAVLNIYSITLFSQQVNHLTTLDGMNNGAINDIVQDSSGFIWIATWDGITRYDGYSLRHYKPGTGIKKGIPSRQVYKLYLDSEDQIWALTFRGICRYNRDIDQFEKYFLENNDSTYYLTMGNKYFVEVDKRIYFQKQSEIYHLNLADNPESREFNLLAIKRNNFRFPFSIRKLNNQLLILKSFPVRNRTNLFRSKLVESEDGQHLEIDEFLAFDGNVTEILSIDSSRHVFIKDNKLGMYRIINNELVYDQYIEDINPDLLYYSSNNKLWIAQGNKGLGCLDLHNGQYTLYDISDPDNNIVLGNQIKSLFEDFSGNLWIGHSGEGISIVNLKEKAFHTYRYNPEDEHSLTCNTVMGFEEFPDGILVATDYDGVNIMQHDPELDKNVFTRMEFPDSFWKPATYMSVWNIKKESDQQYWLASNFGLIKAEYRNKSWSFKQYLLDNAGTKHRKIFIDRNNNMWLGSYGGLYLFPGNQRESMEFFKYRNNPDDPTSLAGHNITEILLDSRDRLWFGTRDNGICLLAQRYSDLNLSTESAPDLHFINFQIGTKNISLNNNEINCLYESHDGMIWAGTQGGGINIIDLELGTVEFIGKEDGLPGENVFGILPDNSGNIWISTNKGICSISSYDETRTIISYNPSDGIQGNVFMVHSYFKGSNDNIYFGGRNGFTYFDPSEIQTNFIAPRVILTDLRIFDQALDIGQTWNKEVILPKALNETSELTFSHKDYDIRIGVAAIHFQDPYENRIAYLLEGFNHSWQLLDPHEQYINIANLKPGKYTLLIKASNSDNVWTAVPRKLSITVTPPWYRTWYGYIITFLFILLLITGLFYLVIRQEKLRYKIKLDELNMNNLKELNESKLRFFTNISHDLKTPLSLVLAPIEYLYKNTDTSTKVREQLALSLRNARILKRLISNIIDFRKFEAGKLKLRYNRADLGNFINRVGMNFESMQLNKNINLMFHLPENGLMVDFDPEKIEQVLYNILSNAFKYTPQGGSILITLDHLAIQDNTIDTDNEQVSISIFNEGNPISEEKIGKIFERFYQANNGAEGSGIGLSVAEKLIEMHQGSISVKNIDDTGVEFLITIPRFTDPENIAEKDPALDEYTGEVLEDSEKLNATRMDIVKNSVEKDLKIVVIEDNSELRAFYRTLLAKEFEFHEADDGIKGLELVEEVLPDIVISDVVMPGMYGYEVCRNIKENLNTCHIPIILLTAQGAPDQIVLGYKSGADAYIVKPFDYEILMSQVASIIKTRERIRQKYCSAEFIEAAEEVEKPKTKDDVFMEILNEDIQKNLFNDDFNVVALSEKLNISRNHLYRKVKALTGYSTVEYIRILKLIKAAELLKTQQYSVKEVCYMTGFRDQSYFTKSFKNHFKQIPTEYIRTYLQAQ